MSDHIIEVVQKTTPGVIFGRITQQTLPKHIESLP